MSQTSDTMELREEDIAGHIAMAQSLIEGFDHALRIGNAGDAPAAERSSGIGTRRRFRSTNRVWSHNGGCPQVLYS